ncbi:MAG: ABC transporter permease [Ruminococcaceae bacterium]|nr:ABC transporter permease [Oscillospiraceae bacterium]
MPGGGSPVAAAQGFVGGRFLLELAEFAASGSDADEPSGSDSPSAPDVTVPVDPDMLSAEISADDVNGAVEAYMTNAVVQGTAAAMSVSMTEATLQESITGKMDEFSADMMKTVAQSFNVDAGMLTSAFNFELDEAELARLMNVFSDPNRERTADSNLHALGYADRSQPTSISVYMVDFTAKERFLAFIDGYNKEMEDSGQEDLVINYTDVTGVLMSSVKTIVDSVSYVLIAFVAVSLIVSSIMIGIITYISVLERTKEIGVLRAIGASKRNISQVFNAETFIIGLCSGAIGVGVTLGLLIPINAIIHALADATDINAQLPVGSAIVLVLLSMLLTILGGLIPSKKAANRDPVIALRSE